MSPRKPLDIGMRVVHRDKGWHGTVTEARTASNRRFTYYVRWDGFDHDSGEYGISALEVERDGAPMSVEEAAQRLVGSILVQFEDHDDDDLLPVRSVFAEIAEVCNVRDFDPEQLPEWETMGWLRERARAALARLASGERIP